jgi:hypothetical protein
MVKRRVDYFFHRLYARTPQSLSDDVVIHPSGQSSVNILFMPKKELFDGTSFKADYDHMKDEAVRMTGFFCWLK